MTGDLKRARASAERLILGMPHRLETGWHKPISKPRQRGCSPLPDTPDTRNNPWSLDYET